MRVFRSLRGALCLSMVLGLARPVALADEGMWTYDNPPRAELKERYGFEPTQEWLDHLRLASIHFGGGSGSFVSPDGLILTNHHVGRSQVQKLSTRENDLIAKGFYARTRAEELACPDLEINVLISMEQVTARVLGAVKGGMTEKQALDARKAEIARITRESAEKTGLRSDVVSLYQGSEYWLYRYKKYTDVRLVMAPEMQIAFFGGDPDNFTYPRYNLDITFFRAYEGGKPAATPSYLRLNASGVADGDLVFVSGHPGSTNRQHTLAQVEHQRDVTYPARLASLRRSLEVLRRYAAQGQEEARRAASTIFGLENSLKVSEGEYRGLLERSFMEGKEREEKEFRSRVGADPSLRKAYGWAWDSVAAALARSRGLQSRALRTVKGRLFGIATQIVEHAAEAARADDQRLAAYQEANIASTRFRLFSRAPVYRDLDSVQMVDGLREAQEALGPGDPFVKAVLAGGTPEQAAARLIGGTALADVGLRKQLFDGGAAAVAASTDPMIALARVLEPLNRETREWTEKYVTAALSAGSQAIGQARFALWGRAVHPDATSSLRLSYGVARGYPMNGTKAPWKTTFYGLYERAESFGFRAPFHLPARYLEGRERLNLATPFNFVCTCDIIGGNSGSPVVNRSGELVGVVFDGNVESFPGRFVYDATANRAVAVHAAAMVETLRRLYGAAALADELEGKAASD